MDLKDIKSLIPKNKFDDTISKLSEIGFPALNPFLPDLLDWIQDINWPIARPRCELLSKAGVEIIPHLIEIFMGDDYEWIYFLITSLLPDLDMKIQKNFLPHVVSFSSRNIEPEYKEAAKKYISSVGL